MNTKERQDGLVIAQAVRKIDEELIKFSDYKGFNEITDDPVWHAWQRSHKIFEEYCDQAIKLHERAIKIWQDAILINAKRRKL